ncbi:zinc finger protein 8 [Drosophila hydei]|uniref:Zinc finger protein 8 n=1 Tax=Drosophila hydei TaxID=7224 RepID=A0A6J1LBU2_DROHY|nr:zinc finger protein 8 [Drosophila hydei]
MRQPEQQLDRELEPDDSYDSCLTEDVQLFEQLDDLEASSELLLLPSTADLDLLQLVSGASDATSRPTLTHCSSVQTHTQAQPIKPKSKRATPTKRQANICDLCGRSFSDGYGLRIHRMTHTDERPHVCEVCGKGFRQLNKLRIHSVTHTDKRPYECDICGKGFRFANYLAVHRRLHTGEKPYSCSASSCSLSFHSIHARRMHMKLQHSSSSGSKETDDQTEDDQVDSTASLSFTCPICGRVLTDQCYLNTHLKRHYNQRDFACLHPGCGKRFFSSSELNHHQIAHTRLRPFRCSLCGSCFLRKSNYKQHMKIHCD